MLFHRSKGILLNREMCQSALLIAHVNICICACVRLFSSLIGICSFRHDIQSPEVRHERPASCHTSAYCSFARLLKSVLGRHCSCCARIMSMLKECPVTDRSVVFCTLLLSGCCCYQLFPAVSCSLLLCSDSCLCSFALVFFTLASSFFFTLARSFFFTLASSFFFTLASSFSCWPC